MKIEYVVSEDAMTDLKLIRAITSSYMKFNNELSEYGEKLLNAGYLDDVREALEKLFDQWVDDQHRRLCNLFNDKLNCGEVDLSKEDII